MPSHSASEPELDEGTRSEKKTMASENGIHLVDFMFSHYVDKDIISHFY